MCHLGLCASTKMADYTAEAALIVQRCAGPHISTRLEGHRGFISGHYDSRHQTQIGHGRGMNQQRTNSAIVQGIQY